MFCLTFIIRVIYQVLNDGSYHLFNDFDILVAWICNIDVKTVQLYG